MSHWLPQIPASLFFIDGQRADLYTIPNHEDHQRYYHHHHLLEYLDSGFIMPSHHWDDLTQIRGLQKEHHHRIGGN